MKENNMLSYIKKVLNNKPTSWLNLTTHRLDIYNEKQAKSQFLEQFESLYKKDNAETLALNGLPTAYDYIRLGHPLSCVLEWVIAKVNNTKSENIISFSSKTIPVLAILRKNLLDNKKTQIVYSKQLPTFLDFDLLKNVYGYKLEFKEVAQIAEISAFEGTTIFLAPSEDISFFEENINIDFYVNFHPQLGSVLFVNGEKNEGYISEIQHVRRRETIAMTPANCLSALAHLAAKKPIKITETEEQKKAYKTNKTTVLESISLITDTETKALLGSCGLSIQYAIMMGLTHDALEKHPSKSIKFIVPPNCYGGTNDQARRVAACIDQVEIVDLPVDGDNDMVQSVETILDKLAQEDAIPFIIAEIPTNPRVEVPDLIKLQAALAKKRKNGRGETAIDPVFVLDQTFCPNFNFLGEQEVLSNVRTISYVSGSKFPSGGLCTAGYCVPNKKAAALIPIIETHLKLCDNEATPFQVEVLAEQMPSMKQRIQEAYTNTRDFVNYIQEVLPVAKINFVSEELARQGFTPSVFSLDLPTKGSTVEEKENYKRDLNYQLINLMIAEIPNESKFCVSYGQLSGCYWTIPATSTQGTTKEGDKDYIVRVSLSPNMDVEKHQKVFLKFVESI